MTVATAVKERPILFSGPMVRAILDGKKTQTRRAIKPRVGGLAGLNFWGWDYDRAVFGTDLLGPVQQVRCPYGAPGDRLWVRETWLRNAHDEVIYLADWREQGYEWEGMGWKPSIHMPRWASRLTLEITGVRVERVQDISEVDAQAEGVDREFRTVVMHPRGVKDYHMPLSYRAGFANLWNQINADRGFEWEANPWVWVVEFRRLEN
jgi:hypothetical protein